jgi:hypothetical protein
MGRDRFLIAILVAIAALAVLAVGLFLGTQSAQDYALDNTPESVLRNYVLALENKDYERAYAYLKDAPGKPDFERFRQDFLSRQLSLSGVALQIGEAQPSGDDVVISLVVIRSSGGPFGDTYREPSSALLIRDDAEAWKIANLPNPYWGWDWYNPDLIKPFPASSND